MKLEIALLACDNNPLYLDFWGICHRAWKDLIGVRAILVLVANEIPDNIEYKEDVILFPPVPGIPPGWQAQCIRELYPALLGQYTQNGIIISDIDMMPLSKKYFCSIPADYPDDVFLNYRTEAKPEIYMCYNIATAKTWNEIFQVNTTENLRNILKMWSVGANFHTDQLKLYEYVMRWHQITGRYRSRTMDILRLDRRGKHAHEFVSHPSKISVDIPHILKCTDFHMNRPYLRYKDYLENVYKIKKLNHNYIDVSG